jgi:hypothetical protein
LVDATFKPVVIRLEVVLSALVVDVRLWRAAIAPVLVFTEKPMFIPSGIKSRFCDLNQNRWLSTGRNTFRPALHCGKEYWINKTGAAFC